jgi:hypothetical protein
MKIKEEALPLGAECKYDCAPNVVVMFINPAKQLARMGPGLAYFAPPLIPNLSKAEVGRFCGEIHKANPNAEITVVTGTTGVAIFASSVDAAWKPPAPAATRSDEWDKLGVDYPGEDVAARAVFDVLAPVDPEYNRRFAWYELGHETTPEPSEVWDAAQKCAQAVIAALRSKVAAEKKAKKAEP